MENKDKIILDLCGGTGSWSRPYKEAGYDVRLITLPEYDVRTYQPPENVYGILAAPPCTEFSIAKGSRPRDFAGGMEIVEACLRIIWRCRMTGSLKFWAMENPVGFLCLRETGRDTVELYVMGVLKARHRTGAGRALVEAAKQAAREAGYAFMQVKTVQMGKYAEYDATNRFYLAMGFREFEVFPQLWDEWNPCQVYVMGL